MGRKADALSEMQVATLEWIRDGCAAVDGETEISRKISAASLHGRGLATVKGAGATWIGDRLFVSRHTVKSHTVSIYGKLGASDRAEAVERAVDVGLLEPYFGYRSRDPAGSAIGTE